MAVVSGAQPSLLPTSSAHQERKTYTIMGATGNTGGATVDELLRRQEPVRAISRARERLDPLVDRGVEAAVGDPLDVEFLTRAFEGNDAVYAMVAPDYSVEDMLEQYRRQGETIVEAVRDSRVGRVVLLSSLGAELPEGTGPIACLHAVEQLCTGLDEVTSILGDKIGKPDLEYVRFPDDDYRQALIGAGFSEDVAERFLEMEQAFNDERIVSHQGRTPRTTGSTTFETFADELAAAYRAK